ncbi:serine hydrolase domain-containing protein [Rhodococcus sp. G-MC3]|uniref:serine hydrolase domain-containing protein n=1 Tax=Rhodococcus sp. G-MC3 TaxID=3046209 RepID=UPI0024B93A11|nr:serine hydrolase domain-containing protein [Rhodococcus sp. G-MC3]MDJ0395058.1 serine hydrolase domain-containing protein [Rhodococcus sp. G-MC3]
METRVLRAFVATLVVAASAMFAVNPVAAEAQPTMALQSAVDDWASAIGAPGMTAQIVDLGGVVAEASTGVDGNGAPVDTATPFVWGSVSKQFTAATVLGLERDGVIDTEEPVVDVLPEARRMLPDVAVTIGDLVHHTSGLPHDITVTDDWTRRGSATDAVASISQLDDTSERGTFRYSSLNYMLLQAVVEQATGESFSVVLRRVVLEPAGAGATITDPDEFTRVVPPGHVPFFGSSKPIDVGVDSAGLGYGYLAGSVDDLGLYASWRLGQLREEGAGDEVETGQGTEYGNGLFHENIGEQNVWWHAGAVPGYYTYVAMIPDQDKAVVLATNRYGEIEAERVAAVGRNLTTLILDGSSSELPTSMARTALGIMLGILAVVVSLIVWLAARIFTGASTERSLAGAVVRILTTVVLCGIAVIGALAGVTSILGASLLVMWRWAPDITLTLWILLGAVLIVAALVVANEVVGYNQRRKPTGQ